MIELPCDCEPSPESELDVWGALALSQQETHRQLRASHARGERPDLDSFFDMLEQMAAKDRAYAARPVFDGRLAEEVAALPDWPGKAQKRIDEMTLADYRRGIDGWWHKRRRD